MALAGLFLACPPLELRLPQTAQLPRVPLIRCQPAHGTGTRFIIAGNNSVSCYGNAHNKQFTADATNAIATCAFTATLDTSVLTGNLSFMTGVLTGSFSDPTNTPTTGPLAGRRR